MSYESWRQVVACLPDFAMAHNAATAIAAMADDQRQFYGIQFHREHTLQGKAIIGRFVHDICGIGRLNMPGYVDEAIGRIRATAGNDRVILGLSGGVDSQ